ncbi:MAG: glycoside hydrolase family 97 N-terminal domain-containing protein, partial [Bacteroidia bacterium]
MMRFLPFLLLSLLSSVSFAEVFTLVSPDRTTKLRVENKAPLLVYELEYRGRTILHSSQIALQLKAFEKEEWKYHSSSPVQYKENKWMAAWGPKID